jgi:hypothetical protein
VSLQVNEQAGNAILRRCAPPQMLLRTPSSPGQLRLTPCAPDFVSSCDSLLHRLSVPTALLAIAFARAAGESPVEQFEREVRPILTEHCFKCHGPEKKKGGLRLDERAAMIGGGDSGEPAVVPGKSGESPLIGGSPRTIRKK